MIKEKKIGIKYFLNKRLKSICRNGIEFFPLYMRIYYESQNTSFSVWFPSIQDYYAQTLQEDKMHFDLIGYIDKEDFKRLFIERKVSQVNKEIEIVEYNFRKLIKFEDQKEDGSYKLRGIKERYHKYINPFLSFGEKDLIRKLHSEIDEKGIKIPDEVRIYFKEHFIEKFFETVQKYVNKDLTKVLSSQFIYEYTCYLCMRYFEAYQKQEYTILDWMTNAELHDRFLIFLEKVLKGKKENGNKFFRFTKIVLPVNSFDPVVLMGAMKRWLLQI
jgi:hypothetical protein